jgi:O-antigen biosynthesis protein WbqP
MKRVFDFTLSLLMILATLPLFMVLGLLIKVTSKGPILFWSKRVGVDSGLFNMPKFRTMYSETPVVATHLLDTSKSYITPLGKFLRKSSLDELPQLFSIAKGEMSFVGPRPALYNQVDLIQMRKDLFIDQLKPGLTGWAQVNGRDELPILQKVKLDYYYFQNYGFWLDAKILLLTFHVVFKSKSISH